MEEQAEIELKKCLHSFLKSNQGFIVIYDKPTNDGFVIVSKMDVNYEVLPYIRKALSSHINN